MLFESHKHQSKIYKDKDIGRAIELAALNTLQWVWWIGVLLSASLLLHAFSQKHIINLSLFAFGIMVIASGALGFFVWFGQNWYARGAKRWRKGMLLSVFVYSLAVGCSLSALTWQHPISLIPAVLWMLAVAYNLALVYRLAPFLHTAQLSIAATLGPIIVINFALLDFENSVAAAILFFALLGLLRVSAWSSELFWSKHEAEYLLRQKQDSQKIAAVEDGGESVNTDFIKSLAQELKQGLNEIVGCIALLKDSNTDPKQDELLEFVEQASDRELDLINDVADFAKIRDRKITLDYNPFNLHRCVEDTIVVCAREAELQQVDINAVIDPAMPARAKGDERRVAQVVRGLLSSVVRFSQHSDVFVQVGCRGDHDAKGSLEITVIDRRATGTISDRIFSGDLNTYTRMGAGLELLICKSLVDCMQGALNAYSNNEGHCYRLNLPLDIPQHQRHFFSPNSKLQGRRLGIVNCPTDLKSNFKEELEQWGIQNYFCASLKDVADLTRCTKAANERIDGLIIFSNSHHHATMDKGWLLLQELSNRADFRQMAFVLVARHRTSKVYAQQLELLKHQNVAMIEKPVRFKELHQVLVRHLLKLELSHSAAVDESPILPVVNRKILLVEDHHVNQMVAEGMLRKLGYEPAVAENGLKALELIQKDHFDLILMDCQMAEMDGYTATRKIRDFEKEKADAFHIPIIALTAHTADEDQSRCFDAGMDDYLAKPVRYADLEGRLRHWLPASSGTGATQH